MLPWALRFVNGSLSLYVNTSLDCVGNVTDMSVPEDEDYEDELFLVIFEYVFVCEKVDLL